MQKIDIRDALFCLGQKHIRRSPNHEKTRIGITTRRIEGVKNSIEANTVVLFVEIEPNRVNIEKPLPQKEVVMEISIDSEILSRNIINYVSSRSIKEIIFKF